jgi:pancreatic triacylglycerol lipase
LNLENAAEKIPRIGRITGLDPAEPFFQGMPEFTRLDPSDAMVKFYNFK